MIFGEVSEIMSFSLALFASLQLKYHDVETDSPRQLLECLFCSKKEHFASASFRKNAQAKGKKTAKQIKLISAKNWISNKLEAVKIRTFFLLWY